jgi:hypothetical protein
MAEATVMAQFSHKNVVHLIGVVTVGQPLLIVLELCELGTPPLLFSSDRPAVHAAGSERTGRACNA